MKVRFLRAAILVATVSGALVVTGGPVAAAGGTVHTRSTSFSTYAHLVGEADGASTWADVNVTVTDPATMTATLDYQQWVVVSSEDGLDNSVLTASGSGDVHLDVAARLSSATVSGNITVTRCQDFVCNPDDSSVVPVQGTWTATGDVIRTRMRTIVSGSKTSRQLLAQNASYRYADATVLVGGLSLGAVGFETDATIADARSSSVDFYFGAPGANLPGTLVSASVTPAAVADPRQRYTSFFQSADASWTVSDGQVRDAYFRASFDRIESRGTLQNGPLAEYYDTVYVSDEFGNSNAVQWTSGWTETGEFTVGPRLATASFVGSIPLQTCTAIDKGEQLCGDPQDVAFDVTWTSTGPTTRSLYNQGYTGWDGGFHTAHSVWETASAVATGTIAETPIGASALGGILQIHDTHDGSAV